jgi:hypothetical protein
MQCDSVAAVNEGGHMTAEHRAWSYDCRTQSTRSSKREGQVISVKVQNCRHFFIRQSVQIYTANQTLVPVHRRFCYNVVVACLWYLVLWEIVYHHHHHHHHHVHEGLGVFPVPRSSKWNWSLDLFLGRPMFLRPFGLYCNACFGILCVSILCTCCSHFSWYCFISFILCSRFPPNNRLIKINKKAVG